MKNKEIIKKRGIIKVATGINRRGVELRTEELRMLRYLEQHRTLKIDQLHQYFCNVENIKVAKRTFTNRLKRLESSRIIVGNSMRFGQNGIYYKYFRMSKLGIDLLKEVSLLPEDYTFKSNYKLNPKYAEHFFATQQMVLETFMRQNTLIEQGENIPVMSINPHTKPYVDYTDPMKNILIIPDWIIANNHHYINLEIDTGSEVISTIEKKMIQYMKLAELYPDITYTVLIVVVDDSFKSKDYYGNRDRRVLNIKERLSYMPGLYESSVDVIVVSMKNAYDIPFQIMKQGEFSNSGKQIAQFLQSSAYPYHNNVEIVNNPEKYISFLPDYYRPDLLIKKRRVDGSEYLIACVKVREGDIKSLEKLRYLMEQGHTVNILWVYAFYEDENGLVNDLRNWPYDDRVYFMSLEQKSTSAANKMYKWKSPSKLKIEK